ncbi:MAG TPA: serine/threonine-protein kinase [Longimicrobiales bacterium]|nr:serine/threonine-protein kinase [Longimicrobiales bacterium]
MWLSDRTLDHLRAVADEPDLSGTRYQLAEPVGCGGMGRVYRARDTGLDRDVALKILHTAEAGEAERLIAEAKILARLEHPGIVPVHDAGTLPDGRVFCAMKLVRGTRLDALARDTADLPERLRIFQRICETVAFAHAHGVLHRDLKPQNIMVGSFGEVLVLDWGIASQIIRTAIGPDHATSQANANSILGANANANANANAAEAAAGQRERPDAPDTVSRATGAGPTAHGARIGTPGWMAPEQEQGRTDSITERTDVFGLGAILRELVETAPREQGARPPARLRAIIERATAAQPADRYPDVPSLADDVGRFLAGVAVSAYREPFVERTLRLARKYRTPILLVLTYLVMRVLFIVIADS